MKCWLAFCAAVASLSGVALADIEQTIEIETGQALINQDLLNGEFDGETFMLSPDLLFNTRNGGTFGRVGTDVGGAPFPMAGASVLFNAGARWFDSSVENAVIDLRPGSAVEGRFRAFASQVEARGTHLGDALFSNNTTALLRDVEIGESIAEEGSQLTLFNVDAVSIDARSGADVSIRSGNVFALDAYSNAKLEVRGGTFQNIVARDGGEYSMSGGLAQALIIQADGRARVEGGRVDSVSVQTLDVSDSKPSLEWRGGSLGSESSPGRLEFFDRSRVEISGGEISATFNSFVPSSTLAISGGNFLPTSGFQVFLGDVELSVTAFVLNGEEVPLAIGETTSFDGSQIGIRQLAGVLADGSPFDLQIPAASGVISGTVTVTRVIPSPTTLAVIGIAGFAAARRRR